MSRRTFHYVFAALLALASGSNHARAVGGAEANDGSGLVQAIGNSVMALFGPIGIGRQEREDRFRTIYRESFDHAGIAATIMGRPWHQASPQQRQDFQALFETLVVKSLLKQLADFAGRRLNVLHSEPDRDGVIVYSQIVDSRTKANINVNWHLRKAGTAFLVRDVTVENISMSHSQRREFAALYQQHGATVDGLIAGLREKIASLDGIDRRLPAR